MKLLKVLIYMLLTGIVFFYACDKDDSVDPDRPSSADREKFIGNWAGSYGCPSIGVPATPDTMLISSGSGALDVMVVLHAYVFNPDTVTGNLTGANIITVPEQEIGGFPGTAKITYSDGRLTLSQSGLGITCQGTDYLKY